MVKQAQSSVLLLPYISLYVQYILYIPCVYAVSVYLDSLAYFPWAWAGTQPAALVLSEDWPHVGLCGRVKIETHTHRHWTGGLGCVFLLNGFKTPVERPLSHYARPAVHSHHN